MHFGQAQKAQLGTFSSNQLFPTRCLSMAFSGSACMSCFGQGIFSFFDFAAEGLQGMSSTAEATALAKYEK